MNEKYGKFNSNTSFFVFYFCCIIDITNGGADVFQRNDKKFKLNCEFNILKIFSYFTVITNINHIHIYYIVLFISLFHFNAKKYKFA